MFAVGVVGMHDVDVEIHMFVGGGDMVVVIYDSHVIVMTHVIGDDVVHVMLFDVDVVMFVDVIIYDVDVMMHENIDVLIGLGGVMVMMMHVGDVNVVLCA